MPAAAQSWSLSSSAWPLKSLKPLPKVKLELCPPGDDTPSYEAIWGFDATEQALCQDVVQLSGQSLSQEAGNSVRPPPQTFAETRRECRHYWSS